MISTHFTIFLCHLKPSLFLEVVALDVSYCLWRLAADRQHHLGQTDRLARLGARRIAKRRQLCGVARRQVELERLDYEILATRLRLKQRLAVNLLKEVFTREQGQPDILHETEWRIAIRQSRFHSEEDYLKRML
jgi:hypothetical protein